MFPFVFMCNFILPLEIYDNVNEDISSNMNSSWNIFVSCENTIKYEYFSS